VRDMVVSRLFGAGFATDAFFAAFIIPNMLRRFFAEGALTSAFVPTFSEWLSQKGEEEARELANVCFTLLTVVMAAVTAAGIIFSPAIVSLMYPGFSAQANKLELTILLNRLMFPYLFFISLVALCMGILNTVRHFFTPAISTVFLNLSMILCALFLHRRFEVPILSLAVGVLLGGVLQLLLQLPVLYRRGFPLRFRFRPRHPAVSRIALLMGPSIFGVGVYYLNITVSNILASLLPQGSVSYLYYAQRLFEFPQGIFTVSIAQAVLPSLSRQAAAGEMAGMRESLDFGIRLTLFITIPAMVGLLLSCTPVFSLLFMGGEFDYLKAAASSEALWYYSLGLPAVALVRVLVPGFYALKDTRTPVITAAAAFVLNLLFSLALMGPLRHGGLAFATTLSAGGNLALLVFFLRRKIGPFGTGVFSTLWRTAAASLPMALFVRYVLTLADWSAPGGKVLKGVVLGGGVGGGAAVFAAGAWLLGCAEAREAGNLFLSRLRRRRG
ncbi:MAG TPA: murein biosynthesis integral membrane protein MurJ, partial [Verrucomicrobiae bacterium]|nr:murein biosynthesis integral membrane protein MurJ [Verrucomicrobiae bacterium]